MQLKQKEKFLIFSDESFHNVGRYRSISAVVINSKFAKTLHDELLEIIKEYSIQEFKWNKLTGDSSYSKAAMKLLDWVFEKQSKNLIRIDTMIWDTQDYRHNIYNRDDNKNFAIMYYKLLNHIINIHEENICFEFYPDKKDGFNWQKLEDYICIKNNIFYDGAFIKTEKGMKIDFSKIRIKISKTVELNSNEYVYIQIADLFAGIAVFSYLNYFNYKEWQSQQIGQQPLFNNSKQLTFSRSEQARYKFLNQLLFHKNKPKSVSLNKKTSGLKTSNYMENINFWFYTPQRIEDKAPTK